jgi:hypothetical protein
MVSQHSKPDDRSPPCLQFSSRLGPFPAYFLNPRNQNPGTLKQRQQSLGFSFSWRRLFHAATLKLLAEIRSASRSLRVLQTTKGRLPRHTTTTKIQATPSTVRCGASSRLYELNEKDPSRFAFVVCFCGVCLRHLTVRIPVRSRHDHDHDTTTTYATVRPRR